MQHAYTGDPQYYNLSSIHEWADEYRDFPEVQVTDAQGNITIMNYDWLGRKTSMTDPDMGTWSYTYDANGNLTTQTDARGQTIILSYDALNRLTGKTYPTGSGMTNVTYTYDSTAGGNYGKGRRTSVTDASGTTTYRYDTRGRLIEEKRTLWSVDYTTGFAYDAADRLTTITYPTGETVTQTYNDRGFPSTLAGSATGNLVTGVAYNPLGQITRINLGNGAETIYGYFGLGGPNDYPGNYYGRLYQIKTTKDSSTLQHLIHVWDAGGNLLLRADLTSGEGEMFQYDFLDRLIGVTGAYTHTYTYDTIGNITAMNGQSYTYGSKPHAVTAVGTTTYEYDANGNMTRRGAQTLTWNVENLLTSVNSGSSSTIALYDGDGNRFFKYEWGNGSSEAIIYVNQYYEKNLITQEVTTHYYLGGKEVAFRKGSELRYPLDDHLFSTVGSMDSSGNRVATVRYFPFGGTRFQDGDPGFDKMFTGQRLDQNGLYYYNARYYDATIGRFISPDTIVPNPANPQILNRYSYCLNNPLKWVDPSGHQINYPSIDQIYSYVASNPTSEYLTDLGRATASLIALETPPPSTPAPPVSGATPVMIGVVVVTTPVPSGAPSASVPSESRVGVSGSRSEPRQEETRVTDWGIRWYSVHGEVTGIVNKNPSTGVEAKAFQAKGRASIFGLYGEVEMIDLDVPVVHDLIRKNDLAVNLMGPGAAASYSTVTGLPAYGGHLAGGGLDLGDIVGGRVYIGLYTPYAGYDSASKQVMLKFGPFEGHFRWPF